LVEPGADELAVEAQRATSLLVKLADWVVAHPDSVTFATDFGDTPTEVKINVPAELRPDWRGTMWADILDNLGFTYHDDGEFLQWVVK
jgi:hypothetical protein